MFHRGVLLPAVALVLSLLATLGPPAASAPNPRVADVNVTATTAPLLSAPPPFRPVVAPPPFVVGAYRFVSSPDFFNQDVGDVRNVGIAPVFRNGVEVNSFNDAYSGSIDHVLSEMRATGARDLLVAGDLVGGRWGQSLSAVDYLGPSRTLGQQRESYRRSAELYFGAWKRFVSRHGLTPFVAVGDHDLGDNNWRRRSPSRWIRFKYDNFPAAKAIFHRQMLTSVWSGSHPPSGQGRLTSYAVRLDESVLLVSLDVFSRHEDEVVAEVDQPTLTWLRTVLAQARGEQVPWVIVQGHTPILPSARARHSSQLRYRGGSRSALWRTMVEGGVDLYFAGEVHDQSLAQHDGIIQVLHGSLFHQGEASYVLGQVTPDRMVLSNQQFRGTRDATLGHLWSSAGGSGPYAITYDTPSFVTGVVDVSIDAQGRTVLNSVSGVFAPVPPA